MRYELKSLSGRTVTGTRHATPASAKREYSAAQRRLYGIVIFALPGGGFDSFPAGHPVPHGARRIV